MALCANFHNRPFTFEFLQLIFEVVIILLVDHASGCADGTTDGLAGYEEIQACKGKWIGHVKRGEFHFSFAKFHSASPVEGYLQFCIALSLLENRIKMDRVLPSIRVFS